VVGGTIVVLVDGEMMFGRGAFRSLIELEQESKIKKFTIKFDQINLTHNLHWTVAG
jgi:hypothetical protein